MRTPTATPPRCCFAAKAVERFRDNRARGCLGRRTGTAAFKAPTRIAKIFVGFIARFFTAESIFAMLLDDGAGKLFCWNRCVHDQHNGTAKSA